MIVQPCALGNSILAKSASSDRAEIVTADLDLKRLRELRASQYWDFNRALLSEILPRAYTVYAQKQTR